ncbi:MAG: PilZ domain-containing protein [Terriglobales bacterium]
MGNAVMHGRRRGARFALGIAIRYRSAGSAKWHIGKTENISCSGVLLRCRAALQPATPVEVRFALPPQLSGEKALDVVCAGSIVRTVQPKLPFRRAAMAVAFETCRVARRQEEAMVPAEAAPLAAARAGDVRHKLNNLLMVILGNSELLLLNTELDRRSHDALAQIRDAAERAGRLAREIR